MSFQVVQLPILLFMFSVVSTAVELRQRKDIAHLVVDIGFAMRAGVLFFFLILRKLLHLLLVIVVVVAVVAVL